MEKSQYNPDVLSCLANLSNDEVFTPPALVNQMLDLLPEDLWKDKNATFLDPVCKTGVFLREIAKRLMVGLKDEIPDLQERADHIFTKQVFGMAITELTALLSRRSLYCSKRANGPLSVCNSFDTENGRIFYKPVSHSWDAGRCSFCGASQEVYDRGNLLESHAYQFIHTSDPKSLFPKMKFDVIIGNPPYQMNVGVEQESYAIPLYHKFIQQSKKLNPRFLVMIVPSRWFSGGRGLDDFRDEMLNDERIREIHDFPNPADCFPGVEIKGGVCYFLWSRDSKGLCSVNTYDKGQKISSMLRPLKEPGINTFIRFNPAISILNKVREVIEEQNFSELVSPQTPFGLISSFTDYKREKFKDSVKIYFAKGFGFISRDQILKNDGMLDSFKVYITKSYGAGEGYPHQILNKPFLGEKNSCCTQTYLYIGPLKTKLEAENVISYIKTKFFRFLVMLKKNTQDAMRGVYQFVPLQDFSESWTDEKLYRKYNLTEEEIAFIESMIRPME